MDVGGSATGALFLVAVGTLVALENAAETDEHLPQTLRVMSWNVLCVNNHFEEMERVIASHPVDVLILIEIRPNLFEQVPAIQERYPYCMAFPAWQGNGIAVLTNRADLQLSRWISRACRCHRSQCRAARGN